MSARLAEEIAEHIEEATNASRNGARDTSFFELKVAGVKATLYAAEQQRNANLIALLSDDAPYVGHPMPKVVDTFNITPEEREAWAAFHVARDAYNDRISAALREGLGLA